MPRNCTLAQLEAVKASDSLGYQTAQWTHVILLIYNVFLTVAILKKIEQRVRSARTRRIFWFHHAAVAVFTFCFVFTQVMHIIHRFTRTECDQLIPAGECIWYRLPVSWALVFFPLFYMGILIDMVLEYLSNSYPTLDIDPSLIGYILALMSAGCTCPSLRTDWGSQELMVNCMTYENKPKSAQNWIFVCFALLTIGELLSFDGYYIFQQNRHNSPDFHVYVWQRKCLKDINDALMMFLPNLCVNIFSFSLFALVGIYFVQTDSMSAVNFIETFPIPLSLVINNLILSYRLEQLPRNNAIGPRPTYQEHFTNLNDFWEAGAPRAREPLIVAPSPWWKFWKSAPKNRIAFVNYGMEMSDATSAP